MDLMSFGFYRAGITVLGVLLTLPLGRAATASAPSVGAECPWTTYEAEAMKTTGAVVGPRYEPNCLEIEASGQRAVRLGTAGQYVEWSAQARANSVVVRYSVADAPAGGGTTATLALLVNGKRERTVSLASRYSHLYGSYPFTNDPAAGKPRNFFDEVRVKDVVIAAGDVVRLQAVSDAGCVVDLVDLEEMPPPRSAPGDALAIVSFGGDPTGARDSTAALRNCVAEAQRAHRSVWVPAGEYRISGDIVVPSGVTVQGAGMWHTVFIGDADLYDRADRRVRFKVVGEHVTLADFAVVGRLNYRKDEEPNDGLVGADCSDVRLRNLWIEHTKVGAWIYNGERLRIEGCRFRNLLADGVNLCVGTSDTVIENCSARGTGDDCFAIWPVPSDQGFTERRLPGRNVIRRCTGQLPFLANGGALYGGRDNRIEDCRFTDITAGCGILISTTFPTADEARKVDNNFSGTTAVRGCDLVRCGGYDHTWAWRGAFQICMERRSIAGLDISDITISDSLSDGFAIAGPGSLKGQGTLANTVARDVKIAGIGLGAAARHAVYVRKDAVGRLTWIGERPNDVRNDSSSFKIETATE